MSTKRAAEPDEPEYPVADRDRCDIVADRLDFSGKLVPQDRPPWLDKPVTRHGSEGLPSRQRIHSVLDDRVGSLARCGWA
jgi:hypothetical protein